MFGTFGVKDDFGPFPHLIFGTNIDSEPWNKHLLGMKKRFSMFPEPQKLNNYGFLRFLGAKNSKKKQKHRNFLNFFPESKNA